jgi:hypothetical protein
LTPAERLLEVVHGGKRAERPVIGWPVEHPDSAIAVNGAERVQGRLKLLEVVNPFGLALQRGIDLNQRLSEDPESGNRLLEELIAVVRSQIRTAEVSGADGILYRLHGANPKHCSPMQYGGFYLERDRELLETASWAPFNLLFVVGDEETYLDFVSDLPASAIGWDVARSGFSIAQMRELRAGPVCAAAPDADIELIPGIDDSIARHLEGNGALAHAN